MSIAERWRKATEGLPTTVILGAFLFLTAFGAFLALAMSDPPPNWHQRLDQIYAEQLKTNQLLTQILAAQERK